MGAANGGCGAARSGKRSRLGAPGTRVRAGCGATARAEFDEPAGAVELHAAVGQIDGDGGESGPPGDDSGREPDAGSESERAAERGVFAKGRGIREAAEDQAARGRG